MSDKILDLTVSIFNEYKPNLDSLTEGLDEATVQFIYETVLNELYTRLSTISEVYPLLESQGEDVNQIVNATIENVIIEAAGMAKISKFLKKHASKIAAGAGALAGAYGMYKAAHSEKGQEILNKVEDKADEFVQRVKGGLSAAKQALFSDDKDKDNTPETGNTDKDNTTGGTGNTGENKAPSGQNTTTPPGKKDKMASGGITV